MADWREPIKRIRVKDPITGSNILIRIYRADLWPNRLKYGHSGPSLKTIEPGVSVGLYRLKVDRKWHTDRFLTEQEVIRIMQKLLFS